MTPQDTENIYPLEIRVLCWLIAWLIGSLMLVGIYKMILWGVGL